MTPLLYKRNLLTIVRMSSLACWIYYLYGQLQGLLGVAGDGTGAGL
jgi:hypothetical protein